jgi:hypothetical protein
MTFKRFSIAAFSALMAVGLAGTAEAASKRSKNAQLRSGQYVWMNAYPRYVRVNGYPNAFVVSRGDSVANIRRTFGNLDPNPPSFAQTYDLRSRLTHELNH